MESLEPLSWSIGKGTKKGKYSSTHNNKEMRKPKARTIWAHGTVHR